MEKLTKEQKIEMVKADVIAGFEAGGTLDSIAEQLIIDGITGKGIMFTEVGGLVNDIGKLEGYILTTKQRQENFESEMEEFDYSTIRVFDDLENHINSMIEKHGTGKQWSENKIKARMSLEGIAVPKKSTLTDWQKATIDCFVKNHKTTREELDSAIQRVGIQNFSHYGNLVHELCYRLIEAITEGE